MGHEGMRHLGDVGSTTRASAHSICDQVKTQRLSRQVVSLLTALIANFSTQIAIYMDSNRFSSVFANTPDP